MDSPTFITSYPAIIEKIDTLDVTAYAQTRNYTNGAVSYLSPYISRGVVSLPLVKNRVLQQYSTRQAYTFIFELAWREYFQRQWYKLGEAIQLDIRQPQSPVLHHQVPDALLHATTGITAIDNAITALYEQAYMHNHVRMYVAGIACNIGRAHWKEVSRWMYYHLADHNIASNTLSWQWVAGTFSSKKYYCDQNNINKYCNTSQQGTFLDTTYEHLANMPVPDVLQAHSLPGFITTLPYTPPPVLDTTKPLLIYNAYNLDPLWRADTDANRVLLLEPSHYRLYPVSQQVLSFILSLAHNIPGVKIYCGELDDLLAVGNFPAIYSRRHPAYLHYPGHKDEPEWLFPQVSEVKGSFMAYWKQCEKYLQQ
jgi:deoxyribodipyrimidine photo-lyase